MGTTTKWPIHRKTHRTTQKHVKHQDATDTHKKTIFVFWWLFFFYNCFNAFYNKFNLISCSFIMFLNNIKYKYNMKTKKSISLCCFHFLQMHKELHNKKLQKGHFLFPYSFTCIYNVLIKPFFTHLRLFNSMGSFKGVYLIMSIMLCKNLIVVKIWTFVLRTQRCENRIEKP